MVSFGAAQRWRRLEGQNTASVSPETGRDGMTAPGVKVGVSGVLARHERPDADPLVPPGGRSVPSTGSVQACPARIWRRSSSYYLQSVASMDRRPSGMLLLAA